ncbi:MAG TPA: hypothetical protein DCY20_07870 [Firmicutes bacterium]|nr:hypothetical protein [Bacillota bacterium]
MITKEKLDRLNELAKKKKAGTLSQEELKEQQALREEYLLAFRSSMKQTIENVTIIDPNGEDVTPEKVKQIKAERDGFIN